MQKQDPGIGSSGVQVRPEKCRDSSIAEANAAQCGCMLWVYKVRNGTVACRCITRQEIAA